MGARSIAILARQFDQVCLEAGLSLPQYRLLLYTRMRPQRASELADRASVKRPTLTALIDGLVQLELVRRKAVEGDRRGIRLELTEAGGLKLEQVEGLLIKRLETFTQLGDEPLMLQGLEALGMSIQEEMEKRLEPRRKSAPAVVEVPSSSGRPCVKITPAEFSPPRFRDSRMAPRVFRSTSSKSSM